MGRKEFNYFKKLFIEEIDIVGVVANICVMSNGVMFQSQFRNAEVIVDGSLC